MSGPDKDSGTANTTTKLLDEANPSFDSKGDAMAFLLHCNMLSSGCKLVGLKESGNLKLDMGTKPEGWNANGPGLYTFRYISPAPKKDVLVMKMITMDTALIVHAGKRGESKLLSLTLNTSDYCISSTFSSSSAPSSCFKNVSNLLALFKNKIVDPLVPKPPTESHSSSSRQDHKDRDILRDGRGRDRPQPGYVDPRITPVPGYINPRHPRMPGFPGGDFGGDLDPLRGGGGNIMGPGQFPRAPGQLGPGPFMPRGFRPRIDPFGPGVPQPGGPPGSLPPNRGGDPNPDHLPPSGGPPDFI